MPPSGSNQPPSRRETDQFLNYRLDELKEDILEIKKDRASVESVENLAKRIKDLQDDFDSLKRIIVGASLSWVAGSTAFLLAVLQIRGR